MMAVVPGVAHLVPTLLIVVAGIVIAWGWAPVTSTTSSAARVNSRYRRPLRNIPLVSSKQSEVRLLGKYVRGAEQSQEDDNEDNDEEEYDDEDEDEENILWQDVRTNGTSVCRICATADGEIPISDRNVLPATLDSDLLRKIDAIYHATSYSQTSSLKYINSDKQRRQRSSGDVAGANGGDGSDVEGRFDPEEERRMVSILRSSLEEAGFELLDRRDLDLCEALNAGYLLRLSIQPDLKKFDPNVGKEFYPEKFGRGIEADGADENGSTSIPAALEGDDLLFDGRVLVFRRGYSEEVTVGRLLLPKMDYLQASIVQKSAAVVTRRLSSIERSLVTAASQTSASIRRFLRSKLADLADAVPVNKASAFVKSKWGMNVTSSDGNETNGNTTSSTRGGKILKLNRYGGIREQFVAAPDLNDAINPFLICEIDYDLPHVGNSTDQSSSSLIDAVNTGMISCEYDSRQQSQGGLEEPMRLLKRVSISNLVDFFSPIGRREVLRGFFQKAKLVEPTYEEVVVVWRPLEKTKKPVAPPKALIEVAEIFGVEDKLPKKMKRRKAERELKVLPSLKIRAFTDVPMANLPAVLPKTKLVFRPADAFVFDTISLVSLAAVLASQRFDNPKFDLVAIVSVSFWIIRTFFRYSNKLARYDLLVNKFLTERISHRGPGALKYLASEAASQKAARVGLLYTWMRDMSGGNVFGDGVDDENNWSRDGANDARSEMTRDEILAKGASEMNSLLSCNRLIKINTEATLDDLEALGGIQFEDVVDEEVLQRALKARWNDIIIDK